MALRRLLHLVAQPRSDLFGLSDADDALFYRRLQLSMASWSVPLIGAMGLGLLVSPEPAAAVVPLVYTAATALLLLVLRVWNIFPVFRAGHNALVLVAPLALHHQLGGFVASGGVLVWCALPPVAAMMWLGARASASWLLAVGVGVVLVSIFPASHLPLLTPSQQSLFFAVNVLGLTVFVYGGVRHFVLRLEQEKARSEQLLANVLPGAIAARLRVDSSTIAERHEDVTVFFADLVGFTTLSQRLPPQEIVEMLNRVFTEFDRLVDELGLEKIKTIGDAYMVVGGLPEPMLRPADAAARLALGVQSVTASLRSEYPELDVRIGLHSGPVVAGVIGRRRFAYDLWGETVNLAARMESHGLPGRIQITEAVRTRLADSFKVERRGPQEIKGVGEVQTWWLVGEPSPS